LSSVRHESPVMQIWEMWDLRFKIWAKKDTTFGDETGFEI